MSRKKQIVLLSLMFFIVFYFFSPLVSLANENNGSYTPLAPLPNLTGYENDGSFGFFVQNSFYLLIGIAGVLAVLMIMIGGIQYMTTGAISGKEEGKERITKALLGLFLAIGAWLILNTINPNILNTDLTIKEIEAPPPSEDIPSPPYVIQRYEGRFTKNEQSDTYVCITDTSDVFFLNFDDRLSCEKDLGNFFLKSRADKNRVAYFNPELLHAQIFYTSNPNEGDCIELFCVVDDR